MLSITSLPDELILLILTDLDPVYSTCFGLTCKKFYAIYTEKYGKLRLLTETRRTNQNPDGTFSHGTYHLHQLLRTWVSSNLVFCYLDGGKFMTPERRLDRMEDFVQTNRANIGRVLYRNYKRMEEETRAEVREGRFSLGYWSRGEECSQMLSMCEGNLDLDFGLSVDFSSSLLFNPVL